MLLCLTIQSSKEKKYVGVGLEPTSSGYEPDDLTKLIDPTQKKLWNS